MTESILIPGYTIHNLLGKGGMATVYLAIQESLNRRVAIKVLSDFSDPSAKDRFFSEAHTIAALSHPRIVTIYDVSHLEDGRPFISMEYLVGGDLNQLKIEKVDERYALNLIRQVAEGLSIVHQNDIIHRDIKPANILFREDGSVALSDFGIAKNLSIDTDLTQAGSSVGSPSYSSPEQICGRHLDQRSDIYSLGVVLLELFVGENPFKGNNFAATAINHTEKPIVENAPVEKKYQALLKKMLAKQADQRFSTVDELIAAIDALLNESPGDNDATMIRSAFFPSVDIEGIVLRIKQYKKAFIFGFGGAVLLLLVYLVTYESETEREIKLLLDKAEQSLSEDRLIQPEFDNARYYFNQILTLEADSEEALEGLNDVDERLVKRYIQLAAERFEKTQLNRPKGDNAIYYYKLVLAIEPENGVALKGLDSVVEKYTELATQAFNRKEYRQGLRHVTIGLELSPEHPELLELRDKYKNKRNPIKRLFDKVLK
ncbi:serine/threonine protein kinase [Agarilytica rhodophyticola]|uniref:serine/threonine protein kinase n=1 Tax=Agarilytica rhodophyticola TaxID=1737490 RepID=UPI000B342C1F|nr:serine/threonine-protein kinase [Agarilytica rhodophyticola]